MSLSASLSSLSSFAVVELSVYEWWDPLVPSPPGHPNGGVVYVRNYQHQESEPFLYTLQERSGKSNAVVFPFPFRIAVLEPLKSFRPRLQLFDQEPFPARFALCLLSILIMLLPITSALLSATAYSWMKFTPYFAANLYI